MLLVPFQDISGVLICTVTIQNIQMKLCHCRWVKRILGSNNFLCVGFRQLWCGLAKSKGKTCRVRSGHSLHMEFWQKRVGINNMRLFQAHHLENLVFPCFVHVLRTHLYAYHQNDTKVIIHLLSTNWNGDVEMLDQPEIDLKNLQDWDS